MPTVSVGLPVYNGEKYLAACLDSLLAQTFSGFELIISDNASKDATERICREYAARDPRIRYHREEANKGASWNFNRVVELARAPYFKWAAYDDWISPDYLEACVRSLEADPDLVLSYGSTVLVDGEGRETEKYAEKLRVTAARPSGRLRQYLYQVGLTNALYAVIRTGPLRASARIAHFVASDIVLLAELSLAGRFKEEPHAIFYRRIHAQASAPSNPSLSQLMEWYDTSKKGSLVLPTWAHFRGYLAAIRRLRAGPLERLRCLAVLLVWQRYGAGNLWREAVLAVRVKVLRRGAGR